jgi:hypothetical protein
MILAEQGAFLTFDRELGLARLATALGASAVGGPLSTDEERLITATSALPDPPKRATLDVADEIRSGGDPLGDPLIAAREQSARRLLGQVLTPAKDYRTYGGMGTCSISGPHH